MSTEIPLVSLAGPDGAGKSTAAFKAATLMVRERGLILAKPNAPAELFTPEGVTRHYDAVYSLLERLHADFDDKGNKMGVLLVNMIRSTVQGRVIEPRLVRNYNPDAIWRTRDLIVDYAVYQGFYVPYKWVGSVQERIDRAKAISGSRFSNLIFFVTVDPAEAVRRIGQRIEDEKRELPEHGRVHHRHMHEEIGPLTEILAGYYEVLPVIREMHPETRIVEIDSDVIASEEAALIITQETMAYLGGGNQPGWVNYP